MNPLKINGNGIANAAGRQLLQIIPINIVTVISVIGVGYGLYYNLKGRISALEANNIQATTAALGMQKKIDDLAPTIIRTDVNVMWLMGRQSPSSPKDGPPK